MKKKVLAGILAATMAFSMAACGSTGSSSDSGSSAASGSTAKTEEKGEPYTVTMVLQGSQQPDEERIEEKINEILAAIFYNDLLAPDGIAIIEHPGTVDFSSEPNFFEHRRYGSVNFSIFKRQ